MTQIHAYCAGTRIIYGIIRFTRHKHRGTLQLPQYPLENKSYMLVYTLMSISVAHHALGVGTVRAWLSIEILRVALAVL